MVRWKQIFGLHRYFLVVYMYHLNTGVTGQGQCSVKTGGGVYVNIDEVIKEVQPKVDGEIITFLVLNVMELNKRDFTYYKENNILTPIT